MKDEKRTVFLSPGELFCIAGSLGLANLPLVGSYYWGYTSDQIREDINRGKDILETRGLLKQNGPKNWEVDPSLSSLIQFIAEPDYCLVLSVWRRDGINQQVFIYMRDTQGLSLTIKDRLYNLVAYKEVKMMARAVMNWLAISQQTSANLQNLIIPPLDLIALLEKIWVKQKDGIDQLTQSGFDADEANHLVQSLAQFNIASNLLLVYPEGDQRFTRQGMLYFLGNQLNMWYNESTTPPEGSLEFLPIPANRAMQRIRTYLRGMASEEGSSAEDEFDVY